MHCWLRSGIRAEFCETDAPSMAMLMLAAPSPPAYPALPPVRSDSDWLALSESFPRTTPVERINDAFRRGKPSAALEEAGVIFHQYDGFEVSVGRPWEFCSAACKCVVCKKELPGRVSASIAYRGLRDRSDRIAIPIAVSGASGILLRPSELKLLCIYANDATSVEYSNASRPGCSDW